MAIRVALVDDHQVVLDGIRRLVSDQPDMEVVGEAVNGRAAVDLVRRHHPDVVVMDISMPDMNGIVAIRRISEVSEDTEVVVLSMHTSRDVVSQALGAGARGYVTKDCSSHEIVNAIHAAARGKRYLSSDIVAQQCGDGASMSATPDVSGPVLSVREKEVLQLIAEGKSTKEIARLLHLSEHTVNRHRVRIMDKLNLRTVAELTRYAIREGLSPLE
jgi:DNA-binding NarL/FixJ family response regulator